MIDVWQIPKYVSVIYDSDRIELYLFVKKYFQSLQYK